MNQQDLERLLADTEGQPCMFCDHPASALGMINIDPLKFNGHEQLSFPVCIDCMDNSENWDLDRIEQTAMMELHSDGTKN